MAMQIPVIATDWGGPADYLDPKCGILVAPTSREAFVSGFADAMSWLAAHPAERTSMGRDGRSKVVEAFDWEKKVDRMIDLYQEVMDDYLPRT
jgi:glycosyltransferase involved in cell wall biosynthesis